MPEGLPVFDLAPRLEKLVKHTPKLASVFQNDECRHWSKRKDNFKSWLDKSRDQTSIEMPVKELLLGGQGGPDQTLKAALYGEGTIAGIGQDAADLLRRVAGHEPESYSIEARLDDARQWFELLSRAEESLAKLPREKDDPGRLHRWEIRTRPLALANPSAFPFIAYKFFTEPVDILFADMPYYLDKNIDKSIEFYRRLIVRVEGVRDHLAGDPAWKHDLGMLGASIWLWTASYMCKAPTFLCNVAEIARRTPVILQGPPGTGKSWTADQLAETIAEDRGRVQPLDSFERDLRVGRLGEPRVVTSFVQFHASYDYEDFVRGFRPEKDVRAGMAFELRDGPFARMITRALQFPDFTFLLIVDEINRADLARVLGECIYLLDRRCRHRRGSPGVDDGAPFTDDVWAGLREGAVTPRYVPAPEATLDWTPGTPFVPDGSTLQKLLPRLCLPDNLLFVGTMNTADRSIAIVDVALRRRFAFIDVEPDIDPVESMLPVSNAEDRDRILDWFRELNGTGDEREPGNSRGSSGILKRQFRVGHSYFIARDVESLKQSLRYKLAPLLKEYLDDNRFSDEYDGKRRLEAIVNEIIKYSSVP